MTKDYTLRGLAVLVEDFLLLQLTAETWLQVGLLGIPLG